MKWKTEKERGRWRVIRWILIQVALVICGHFICEFAYMYFKNGLFSGTYPLIYSDCRSFYMRIHYMAANFWSPYLSNIMRSNCIYRESWKERERKTKKVTTARMKTKREREKKTERQGSISPTILRSAFTLIDLESVKWLTTCLSFLHFWSPHVKAVHRTLMKFSPNRDRENQLEVKQQSSRKQVRFFFFVIQESNQSEWWQ